jgi:hypothetical protein
MTIRERVIAAIPDMERMAAEGMKAREIADAIGVNYNTLQMTAGTRDYLTALSTPQRTKLASDSRKALAHAFPNRHTLRGRQVVTANVTMLRNLAAL